MLRRKADTSHTNKTEHLHVVCDCLTTVGELNKMHMIHILGQDTLERGKINCLRCREKLK